MRDDLVQAGFNYKPNKTPLGIESSETWYEYIKLYFETKLAILHSLYDFSRIFQQDVLTGRTDESQVPSDEEHRVFAGFTIE